MDDEVFVSKVVIDLTISGVSRESAQSLTEDVYLYILARMDNYACMDHDLTAQEIEDYELSWDANTTAVISREG